MFFLIHTSKGLYKRLCEFPNDRGNSVHIIVISKVLVKSSGQITELEAYNVGIARRVVADSRMVAPNC
jgi:hypothetical protein